MNVWKECKLGDVASYVNRGVSPLYVDQDGVLVINQKCIRNGRIDLGPSRLSSKTKKFAFEKNLQLGDILINSTGVGTAGRVAFFNNSVQATVDSHVTIVRVNKADPKYVFYVLFGMEPDIETFAEGSTGQIELGRERIKDILISLPPLPEQRSIAAVLSSLDDKIDLLHRQNKTLESLAETLWRKAFEEDPHPEWEERGLDEIADFLNGLPCQKYPPLVGGITLPVIKIKELRNGFTDDSDLVTDQISKEYIIEDGDIVFSWSGSLEVVVWAFGKGALNQHLFKVTSQKFPKWFYFYWIRHHLSDFQDIAQDKATTMGHIQRHHLSDANVVIPDKETFETLDVNMTPIFNKILNNLKERRKLGILRDTLLPKMMAGEVKIPA